MYNILHTKDLDVTVRLVPSPPGPVASPRLSLVRLVSRTHLNILKTENKTGMKSRRTTIECSKDIFQDSQNNVAVHATCLYVNMAESIKMSYRPDLLLVQAYFTRHFESLAGFGDYKDHAALNVATTDVIKLQYVNT